MSELNRIIMNYTWKDKIDDVCNDIYNLFQLVNELEEEIYTVGNQRPADEEYLQELIGYRQQLQEAIDWQLVLEEQEATADDVLL